MLNPGTEHEIPCIAVTLNSSVVLHLANMNLFIRRHVTYKSYNPYWPHVVDYVPLALRDESSGPSVGTVWADTAMSKLTYDIGT